MDKFQTRSFPSMFIGYSHGQKSWKSLKLSDFRIFHSRDVIFHEHVFPYSSFFSSNNTFPSILYPFICDTLLSSSSTLFALVPPLIIHEYSPPSVPTLRKYFRHTHPHAYLNDFVWKSIFYLEAYFLIFWEFLARTPILPSS